MAQSWGWGAAQWPQLPLLCVKWGSWASSGWDFSPKGSSQVAFTVIKNDHLLSSRYVPGRFRALHTSSHLTLIITRWGRCYSCSNSLRSQGTERACPWPGSPSEPEGVGLMGTLAQATGAHLVLSHEHLHRFLEASPRVSLQHNLHPKEFPSRRWESGGGRGGWKLT